MDGFQVGCSQNGGHGTCSTKTESLMDLAWFNHEFTIPIIFPQKQIVHDIITATLTALVALACLYFLDEMAKRDVFGQVFCCNCFSFLTKLMSCFFSFYCSFVSMENELVTPC